MYLSPTGPEKNTFQDTVFEFIVMKLIFAQLHQKNMHLYIKVYEKFPPGKVPTQKCTPGKVPAPKLQMVEKFPHLKKIFSYKTYF